MSKYKTTVYADYDHLLQYMENSLAYAESLPVVVAEYENDDVHISVRRFDTVAPVKFLVMAGRKGRGEISIEVCESGVFLNKGMVESNEKDFHRKMAAIVAAYQPDAINDHNSYHWHEYAAMADPVWENTETGTPEIPGLFDKIKRFFR